MSLINDALKQARLSRPVETTTAAAAGTPVMRPTDISRRADNGGLWLPVLICATLLASGVLVWQWLASDRVMEVRARVAAPAAPATAPAIPRIEEKVSTPVPPAAANTENPSPIPPIAPPVATNEVAVEEPKPAPVVYKLQGIFYRPANPAAVINGKQVSAGSRVGDAHVVLIEKDAVTLVTASGQTNVLELP